MHVRIEQSRSENIIKFALQTRYMYLETNILLQIVTCILYYVYVCTYLTELYMAYKYLV